MNGPRKSKRGSGFRATDRDAQIVEWIAQQGLATVGQVRRFVLRADLVLFRKGSVPKDDISESAVYRILKRLCDAGYLRHEYVLHGEPGVFLATQKGANWVESDVSPASVDLKDFRHDLQLVDLWLELYGLPILFTERQIRARTISYGRESEGRFVGMRKLGRVPDMLLVHFLNERWAVELEIAGKDNMRYYDICDGYARRMRRELPERVPPDDGEHLEHYVRSEGEIDGVLWYFFSDEKRRRAQRAAEKVIADHSAKLYDTRHYRHLFFGADERPIGLPPMDKREKQDRVRRQAEEQEREKRERTAREEQERREAEARRLRALASAKECLSSKERDRAIEQAATRKQERGDWRPLTRQESERTLIEAARQKNEREQEKEQKRQRRRDAVKGIFRGE